jgi:DNA-binding protein HU-beta
MNKAEMVDALASQANVSKKDARAVLDAIFDPSDGLIANSLRRGERVAVTGFGTFEARERGPRVGRNPRTGKEIQIGPSKAPAFRPGKGLRDAIQQKGR